MNAGLVTARVGSKSILNKNMYPVLGRPLIYYAIRAALDASRLDRVYVTTDGESIAEFAQSMGCEVIRRPEELCTDDANYGDVIRHAVDVIDSQESLENVSVTGGNIVMVDGELIDLALQMLDEQPALDSVMSVFEAGDDHPLRALRLDEEGLLVNYSERSSEISSNRQSYPPAYFLDALYVLRKDCARQRGPIVPWWWMGEKSAPIVRPWASCRDIHSLFDIALSEWWIQGGKDLGGPV